MEMQLTCSLPSIPALAFLFFVLVFAGCDSGDGGPVIIECGGGAGFVCPKGLYCEFEKNCGGFDKKGQCRPQPPTCPNENLPVCGCDGKEYGSPCYANAVRISVAYPGHCMRDVPGSAGPFAE